MKKQLFLATSVALGAASLIGCSSDDFVGKPPEVVKEKTAILFHARSSHATRANLTGAEAADTLGKTFRVYGTMTKDGTVTVPFDNYTVIYNGRVGSDNTNVEGWTYIADADGNSAYSRALPPALQEIHCWDQEAEHYDFVAFSGIPDSQPLTADDHNTISADATNKNRIFFSNRVTATADATSTGNTPNAQYGKPYPAGSNQADVFFTFYHLASKLRCGVYETIPGYAVKNLRFYYDDNYLAQAGTSAKEIFGLRGTFPISGDYTVSYDSDNNPVTHYDGTNVATSHRFGHLQYTTAPSSLLSGGNLNADGSVSATGDAVYIGSSAATVTFAAQGDEQWQTVLPYENNAQRLVLRADYDLVPHDGSQAIISVKGASAVVPLEYCQWRPNHAYTYIFRITGNTGTTGTPTDNPPDPDNEDPNPPDEPQRLFPITFDAQASGITAYDFEKTIGE